MRFSILIFFFSFLVFTENARKTLVRGGEKIRKKYLLTFLEILRKPCAFIFKTLKYVTSPSPILNNREFEKFRKVDVPVCF